LREQDLNLLPLGYETVGGVMLRRRPHLHEYQHLKENKTHIEARSEPCLQTVRPAIGPLIPLDLACKGSIAVGYKAARCAMEAAEQD
jgi:hypothetical protein